MTRTDWILLFIYLSLVVGIIMYFCYLEQTQHRRLIRQYMEDGRKEYECESMLRRPTGGTIVPFMIPIRR